MPTEFDDQVRLHRVHGFEQVANMNPLDGSRRPFQHGLILVRKCDDGPVAAFADARGNQADHALVPVRLEDTHAGRPALLAKGIHVSKGLVAHGPLDVAAFTVDLVEQVRMVHGDIGIVREQAFDADGDILEPAGRVDTGTDHETEITADAAGRKPARLFQERFDSCHSVTRTDPEQPLVHEYAVVVIERHDVVPSATRSRYFAGIFAAPS